MSREIRLSTISNHLLGTLLSAEPRLAPSLEHIELGPGQHLAESGEHTPHAYFPETAVVSLITVMHDGSAVEAATVGKEGFVAIALALSGLPYNSRRTVAQVPGRAWRMPSPVLHDALIAHRSVHAAFLRYTEALLFQVMQSSACNQLHAVRERCARWLLMTHDRVGDDSFILTQRYLAVMLAVRRASVSEVAAELQRSGYISYRRGRITICDRAGLESASCECYRRIKREYERQLVGSAPGAAVA
jgi:CRP-like cAMP-binding protein